ncbi:hypothetical protein [Paenibacillus crassostreae]|uniref:Uncharacterized protein n=1 Tax=Paenibacillus crassostreae TaxID=1763538 RepID=A0A167ANE5_9BACL|nr:hypothetical protein [Paenibacillus crassostreae]AOZ93706.1 hypothetical protein LPB68_16925 [Paenibacillus crassostreae]OAB71241.1 hypothetical protein PNBC_19795 [Paenibacillus crassostreae]
MEITTGLLVLFGITVGKKIKVILSLTIKVKMEYSGDVEAEATEYLNQMGSLSPIEMSCGKLLSLNNEDIFKLHLRDLQNEAERFRIAQQMMTSQRKVSRLNRNSQQSIREKGSIFKQIFNVGRRMF